MTGSLGHAGVLLAFLGSLVGAGIVVTGLVTGRTAWLRYGRSYVWLLVVGAVLAVSAMEWALLNHDFSLDYVARNNSTTTPTLFTIAGLWAALEGSILLWGFVLVGYVTAMVVYFRRRAEDPIVAWATAICFVVTAFFFGLMLGPADPFREVAGGIPPAEGAGPNPLLQNHPLMAVHPPLLYAGYIGFTIPFAFGIASLVTGRIGEGWLLEVRRWALVSWALLTGGIVLGAWWSYEVLGWGGYWAWDPVENASLLPWLTATAYLHSVMVQERRRMLRVWNLSLLSSTFALTILGTFFTRSGVLDSVHAFSESTLGPALLGAFAVIVAVTCGLVFWRSSLLGSPGSIRSVFSREAAFLGNNFLFAAFAFVVLLGTVFPLVVEALNSERLSIGRPYFDTMIRPIGLMLLFLMAVSPFLTWGGTAFALMRERLLVPAAIMATTAAICVASGVRGFYTFAGFSLGAFVAASAVVQLTHSIKGGGVRRSSGRHFGGMVAHLGVALIAVALTASQSYATRGEFKLQAGESAEIAGHTITFVELRTERHPNRLSTVADLRVDGGAMHSAALSTFPNSNDAIGTPSVETSLIEDVYLTLVRTPSEPGEQAVISVIVQPLVAWLWIGGAVIVAGAALALPSGRGPKPERVPRESHDSLVSDVSEPRDDVADGDRRKTEEVVKR